MTKETKTPIRNGKFRSVFQLPQKSSPEIYLFFFFCILSVSHHKTASEKTLTFHLHRLFFYFLNEWRLFFSVFQSLTLSEIIAKAAARKKSRILHCPSPSLELESGGEQPGRASCSFLVLVSELQVADDRVIRAEDTPANVTLDLVLVDPAVGLQRRAVVEFPGAFNAFQ